MTVEDKYLKEYIDDDTVYPDDIPGIRYRIALTCFSCKHSTGGGDTMRCKNPIVIRATKNPRAMVMIDKKYVCSFYKEET
jgi:hypothetical protein